MNIILFTLKFVVLSFRLLNIENFNSLHRNWKQWLDPTLMECPQPCPRNGQSEEKRDNHLSTIMYLRMNTCPPAVCTQTPVTVQTPVDHPRCLSRNVTVSHHHSIALNVKFHNKKCRRRWIKNQQLSEDKTFLSLDYSNLCII